MDISLERFYQKLFAMKMSMPELFISKVAHAVVSAISFMKDSESIHRDIKPPNVLLNYKGQIKVCDFGVSGFIKNSVAFTWVGTNNYMAVIKHLFEIPSKIHSINNIFLFYLAGKN